MPALSLPYRALTSGVLLAAKHSFQYSSQQPYVFTKHFRQIDPAFNKSHL